MKKVNIRYLVPGTIKVEIPEEVLKLSKKEIRDWAYDVIEEKSNIELLEGLEMIDDRNEPIENRIFDYPPWVEAVEDTETCETLVKTVLWEQYMSEDKIAEE